jgi:ferredoxin
MKVSVDRSRCQGHNRCHAVAAEFFHLDELGYAYTDEQQEIPADAEELVVRAARACPELAVRMQRSAAPGTTPAGRSSEGES